MSPIPYVKLNGCQNEYNFVDLRETHTPETAWPELAISLAQREQNDGLILIEHPTEAFKADVKMRIFNADGSEAEMCGNGLRCVAMMVDQQKPKDEIQVETVAGIRECRILERSESLYRVQANMGRPSFIPSKIPVNFEDVLVVDEEFDVEDKTFRVSCVNIGNPHCVIEVSQLDEFDVERYGSQISTHEAFPQGINVEFIENSNGEVHQRTYERGSGETMACGSGACAVGVTLIMRNRIDSPVLVHLRGGDLEIEWDGLKEVYMTGDAVRGESKTYSAEAVPSSS